MNFKLFFENKLSELHNVAYHNTNKAFEFLIQRNGLKINQEWNKTTGAKEMIDEIYAMRPIFLSLNPSKFKNKLDTTFEINIEGLDIVADIPSVYDNGAHYEDNGMWFEEDSTPIILLDLVDENGMIYYEDMLNKDHPLCKACIELTGTMACLQNISTDRIKKYENEI